MNTMPLFLTILAIIYLVGVLISALIVDDCNETENRKMSGVDFLYIAAWPFFVCLMVVIGFRKLLEKFRRK